MVFAVLGAVAELERGLVAERVKAGLRKGKARGKRLGRPKRFLDTQRIAALRSQGIGWKRIAADMGVAVLTLYRFVLDGSKIRKRFFEALFECFDFFPESVALCNPTFRAVRTPYRSNLALIEVLSCRTTVAPVFRLSLI